MSGFQDQMAEHASGVFLNESHFSQSMMHFSKTGDPTQFSGVLDSQAFKHENNDEADRDLNQAHLTVSVATADNLDRDGWIMIGMTRYMVDGEVDRDRDFVTLLVKQTKNRFVGAVYPRDAGRTMKHA